MDNILVEQNISGPENNNVSIKKISKKMLLYEEDRKNVVKKLNNILGITDTNNSFVLYELENNIDKQNKINELELDVKKYFVYSSWSYFNAKNKKRTYMSLLRSIYKTMGYDIAYKSTKIKINEQWITTQNYYIIKRNS